MPMRSRLLALQWLRPARMVLAGVLFTATAAAVVHWQAHGRLARRSPAPSRLLVGFDPSPSSESAATQPPMTAVPTISTRPSTAPAVARAPVAAPWRPAHPRGDYMGSGITTHADAFTGPGAPTVLQSGTPGIDVSNWQGQIKWTAVAAQGVRYTYIKATEATTYIDPDFAANYSGSANAGLIRGAYHFAVPNASSGAAQADFFVDHGGSWTADGRTLPPALDIEYNPYGSDQCYGLTPSQMTSWVADFTTTVYNRTARWPVIYTTTNWWAACTGDSPDAAAHDPLWLASWGPSGQVRARPAGWSSYTVWQYADRGTAPGDQDFFHGSYAQLQAFAAQPDRPPNTPAAGVAAPVTVPPGPQPTTPVTRPPITTPAGPTAPTTPPGVQPGAYPRAGLTP